MTSGAGGGWRGDNYNSESLVKESQTERASKGLHAGFPGRHTGTDTHRKRKGGKTIQEEPRGELEEFQTKQEHRGLKGGWRA